MIRPLLISLMLVVGVPSIAAAISTDRDEHLMSCDVLVAPSFRYSGMCLVRRSGTTEIVYLLTTRTVSQQIPEYFFYLYHDQDKFAFWNNEPFASHAHDSIGVFELTDNCYEGQQFRICKTPLWE